MEGSLKQASREEPFNILNIISHYRFSAMPDEMWNNTPCYKIRFAPKGDQPYRNREEKVANALAGYLWIEKSDYSLLHNVGTLTQPVRGRLVFRLGRESRVRFRHPPAAQRRVRSQPHPIRVSRQHPVHRNPRAPHPADERLPADALQTPYPAGRVHDIRLGAGRVCPALSGSIPIMVSPPPSIATVVSTVSLVILPSYNSGAQLLETIRAALACWRPVWVVIDASTDGSEKGPCASRRPSRTCA